MEKKIMTFRQSIFATKPTHTRIKTQIDCSPEQFKTQKEFLVKKPLRRHNNSEFDLRFFKSIDNKSISAKRPVAETSLFGQINLHMPKFRRQINTEVQLEHPLKQYIKLGQKQGAAKRGFKRYKTSCDDMIIPSRQLQIEMESNYVQTIESQQQCITPSNEEECTLFKLVDDIYRKIGKFKQVGYTQKKINEWIQRYCLHKRKYMTQLLMRSTNKHKFSQTILNYFYEKQPGRVKEKLFTVVKKINGKEKKIDQYDLMEFSDYMEQILIQKNKIKIFQLRDSINQKLDECFIYNRERNEYQFSKKLNQPDVVNFITDLNQIQIKSGKFDKISSFNRQYFSDLGKTQKQIRNKIYDLIKITQNRTKKYKNRQLNKQLPLNSKPNDIKNLMKANNNTFTPMNNTKVMKNQKQNNENNFKQYQIIELNDDIEQF